MSNVLSALVGVSMLGWAGVANAAWPVALTDAQMDAVTAGGPFINGGFEEGSNPGSYLPLRDGSTTIKRWTVIGLAGHNSGIDYYGTGWQNSPLGSNPSYRSVDLNGTPGPGGIKQTFDTVPNHQYRVTFDLAGHPSGLIQYFCRKQSRPISDGKARHGLSARRLVKRHLSF
jgi:hypothetical protein